MRTHVEALLDACEEFRAAARAWSAPRWTTVLTTADPAEGRPHPRLVLHVRPVVPVPSSPMSWDADLIADGERWVRERAGWHMVLGPDFEFRREFEYRAP